jgi:hypothetical protein
VLVLVVLTSNGGDLKRFGTTAQGEKTLKIEENQPVFPLAQCAVRTIPFRFGPDPEA